MFNNLIELVKSMPTEEICRKYLAEQRWENGKVICPYCGHGKCYDIEAGKRYKCGSRTCYKKFSVTVGTIFEASNVPLQKWFMLHRIRELMREKTNEKLDNIVEIDETWIGGKVGNMTKKRRAALRTETNGTIQNKTMVMGLIERSGKLKLVALGQDAGSNILVPIIRDNVDKDAVLITDSLVSYSGLDKEFAGHETVNHSEEEYCRDGVINTNSIEGAFSLLKRSIIGIYHQVTPKHLSRYCDETMYRYNLRKMKDSSRFKLSLQNIEGRLTYKVLTAKKDIRTKRTVKSVPPPKYARVPILQIQNGQVIAEYPTLKAAAAAVGCSKG